MVSDRDIRTQMECATSSRPAHGRSPGARSRTRALLQLVISLAGCAGDDRAPPERIADTSYASTLQAPGTVCTGAATTLTSVTVPLSADAGDTLYLFAKTTALRDAMDDGSTANLLDEIRITCPGRSVQSTRNHRGVSSPDQVSPGMVQYASLLYHPAPGTTQVTCQLEAIVGEQSRPGCLSFQAGDSNTWLHPYVEHGGWAWGTSLDAYNATDNNGFHVTIVGPGLAPASASYPSGETTDLGSSEYVLKGRRVSADPSAVSLSVIDDLELTCESNNTPKLCDVTAALLVQRMKSPMNSDVCTTTTITQNKTLNRDTHHEKLYLRADPVSFNTSCDDGSAPVGRDFIVKSQVTLTPGNDNLDYIVVEHGQDDDVSPNATLAYHSGFSIANVLQNF